ncbi:MAG TPA: amidohydrolase family protein [Gemmatimonadaceae bacterium]|nr:amidohydrolase family protein [Gemmatimonadaceae bacterium]
MPPGPPEPPGGGGAGAGPGLTIVDAHVHFWDPAELHYPWLDGLPALGRSFLPAHYRAAVGGAPVERVLFVEANCLPDESRREVALVERLAAANDAGPPRVAGIVAFADLTAPPAALGRALDALARRPRVKGVRQNIQGHAPGFALERGFVDGVAEVGRRGLTFDLCATHDQMGEVLELVERCPATRLVLDHCGKPAIRDRRVEPWAADVARIADHEHVCCKLSGLLTEAGSASWRDEDLVPYAEHVLACFGPERVMFGSDWPVLTLAGTFGGWYGFTERLTASWSPAERQRFYGDNAVRVYGL